jgi:hypothetical protein
MTTQATDNLIQLVNALIRDGEEGEESFVFQDGSDGVLASFLLEGVSDEDYLVVCQRLIMIAFRLETEEHCPCAASVIAKVVQNEEVSARATGLLSQLKTTVSEKMSTRLTVDAERSKQGFSSLTATRSEQKAPRESAPPPTGAVKLNALVQPGLHNDARAARARAVNKRS